MHENVIRLKWYSGLIKKAEGIEVLLPVLCPILILCHCIKLQIAKEIKYLIYGT